MKKDASPSTPGRRALLGMGLAGTGAALAATAVVHRQMDTTPAATAVAPTPERGGGYHLSERAKQYYRSAARV
jgi:hypothetical protein